MMCGDYPEHIFKTRIPLATAAWHYSMHRVYTATNLTYKSSEYQAQHSTAKQGNHRTNQASITRSKSYARMHAMGHKQQLNLTLPRLILSQC